MKRLYLVLFVSLFIFNSLMLHAMKADGAGEVNAEVKVVEERGIKNIFDVKTVADVETFLDRLSLGDRIQFVGMRDCWGKTVFFGLFSGEQPCREHGEVTKAILDRIPAEFRLEILSIESKIFCATAVCFNKNHYVIAACFNALSKAEQEGLAMMKDSLSGVTALHRTCSPEVTKLLIDTVHPDRRIGYINLPNRHGDTALICACEAWVNDWAEDRQNFKEKMIILLAQPGIDISVVPTRCQSNPKYKGSGGYARGFDPKVFDDCMERAKKYHVRGPGGAAAPAAAAPAAPGA